MRHGAILLELLESYCCSCCAVKIQAVKSFTSSSGGRQRGVWGRLRVDRQPSLEIVASYSVGLDKIDLSKCEERRIRVTNSPDVLTDDVAGVAIGLALATLRKICWCDRSVRSGLWRDGDFQLGSWFLLKGPHKGEEHGGRRHKHRR
ncbi:hypothetical protein RHSIM_Rhsim03G0253800 [Rhododendron simsii]|uniref:D-isomer specific 2-hydroxyacid dehydrogenase catalytic domain-containing protein n=1 Tax=Rhododendron simsii TaxID=118357 RepID=A0A834H4L5_RHOSS|nr:hypothetical protein RHSIM_Rhsim03G0253800 [Rhododendron simsii]